MDTIQFSSSKSGKKTCTADGIKLHSAYDPEKEAQRFVSSLHVPSPTLIVISEPALSYCAPVLRTTFPSSILVCVRFTSAFDEYNHLWDAVFTVDDMDGMLHRYGEDLILGGGFHDWAPSRQAFPKEYEKYCMALKDMLQAAADILGTRAYFGQRWLKNTIRFCSRLTQAATLQPGDQPILMAASGPSLATSIPFIQQYRAHFFLLAVSSAYAPLTAAGVTPDLCITTDGGYWAKCHTACCTVPIAAPAESAIHGGSFHKGIVPLTYGDAPEKELLELCRIPTVKARRNGTVSGTALELAMQLSSAPIFACGLDLSPALGFPHCQPNRLELLHCLQDSRLRTKETRLFPQQLTSPALSLYAQWFRQQRDASFSRCFRLADTEYQFKNDLGGIQDIDWNDFLHLTAKLDKNASHPPRVIPVPIPPREDRIQWLRGQLQRYKHDCPPEYWYTQLVPAECIQLERSAAADSTTKRITEKMHSILDKMLHYLDILEQAGK